MTCSIGGEDEETEEEVEVEGDTGQEERGGREVDEEEEEGSIKTTLTVFPRVPERLKYLFWLSTAS